MSGFRSTLRVRLALGHLFIFACTFLLVLVVGMVLFRDAIERSVRDQLERLAASVAESIKESPTTPPITSLQPMDRRVVLLALRGDDGRVIDALPGVDHDALPPVGDASTFTAEALLATFEEERGGLRYLVPNRPVYCLLTFPFESGEERRYLQLAHASDVVGQSMRVVRSFLVVGALGGLVASALSGWILAGRAVQPIARIAATAASVSPEKLDVRFDAGDDASEVEELQEALNRAMERLSEGYQAQERFIANVSHDLKTPITTMLTESQVITGRDATLEELRAYAESVEEEMRRLGGLVEGFLTIARADQGDQMARREVVPVNDLVVESIEHCDPEAAQYEVHLVPTLVEPGATERDTEVYGDPDLLCTMLDNLVRNAIRFSPIRGVVNVDTVLGDGTVAITVRDRGPGVPAEYVDTLFDRFVRAPTDDVRGSGTGLGLAIARSVAEMHDGTISVRNRDGGGCAFTVVLPLFDGVSAS